MHVLLTRDKVYLRDYTLDRTRMPLKAERNMFHVSERRWAPLLRRLAFKSNPRGPPIERALATAYW